MILTGDEPKHWHRTLEDGRVVHALGDPRKDGTPKSHLSADERRYVAHLEACEARYDPARVEPGEGDLELTTMMLALIKSKEDEAAKLRQIVVAIRQAQDGGKSEAEIAAMFPPWPDRTTTIVTDSDDEPRGRTDRDDR